MINRASSPQTNIVSQFEEGLSCYESKDSSADD